MKAAALRGALSDRARDGRVHVVSGLVDGDTPSTKTARTALAAVTEARHVLVVLGRDDEINWRSLRNLPSVHLIAPDQLNTYDVLVNDDVVFTKAALDEFLAAPAGRAKATARSSEVDGRRRPRASPSEGEPKQAAKAPGARPSSAETAEEASRSRATRARSCTTCRAPRSTTARRPRSGSPAPRTPRRPASSCRRRSGSRGVTSDRRPARRAARAGDLREELRAARREQVHVRGRTRTPTRPRSRSRSRRSSTSRWSA